MRIWPDDDAIDEDVVSAGCQLAWAVVASVRGQAGGTDDAEVGGHPGGDPAAVAQPVSVGGVGGQVPGEPLIPGLRPGAEVLPGEPGKRAVTARVRMLSLVDPVRSGAMPVVCHDPGQVIVGEGGPVEMTAEVKARRDQQVEHPSARRVALALRGFGDRKPCQSGHVAGDGAEVDVAEVTRGELLAVEQRSPLPRIG